jgi:hypothetical protein
MRKNLAGTAIDFHIATSSSWASRTCPQFLWINLCGTTFPQGKSMIFIAEISPMKNAAAPTPGSRPESPVRFFTFFVDKIVRKRT